jgi:DNA-binding NarL/FixJ family response regulator
MRIIIVDDNKNFIDSIINLLEMEYDYIIVATFLDGDEFINNHRKYTYDVVLMDINMPILNGFQATKKYNIDFFHTSKVIAVTFDETVNLVQLMEHGFKGCILKPNVFKSIDIAIKEVFSGKYYWDDDVIHNLH